MADMNDVLLAIGRLQASVDHLGQDFTHEKRSAAESRKALYERHDELNSEVARVASDVKMSAHEVKRLGDEIAQHKQAIQPSIDDWRRIKTLGLGVTGVLAIGGLSVGAVLVAGIDAFKAVLRSWLGG